MKVLVVEDNQKLAESIKEGLVYEGFAVDCLFDGQVALDHLLLNRSEYDVLLLDLMLPHKDGIEICRVVREHNVMVPILMLTARDAVDDKVQGLNAGADDYLAKPFAFEELLARVRALLRRPQVVEKTMLEVGDIVLDPVRRVVTKGGAEIMLTLKEYMVLEYFLRNKNKVITRDELYDHAWDFADSAFSNTVNVHIKNVRQKIHDTGNYIQTIRGVGYKMEG